MLKKWKGILSVFICVLMLCTVMPITGHAADNAASVTFGGNTENYTTIDAAWTAAVALDTTAENKATIKLLTNCKTENTLTNTADYLVLDTNGKTLTTPDAIHNENNILCGISVEGGNLEIIGNGTITGLSSASYARGILRITGGEAYANGVTIHNTGLNGSNAVVVNGGSFHLLDGYLLSDSEYALDALSGKVYLYSGKIESTGRLAASFSSYSSDVQICYSDKPLYFVDNDTNNWSVISNVNVQLADNLIMDLEYSDHPDGSDSKTLKNVTEIDTTANTDRNYLKIQTYKPSYLFSTNYNSQLLKKIKNDGVTALTEDAFTAVHFVDLADYDMTNITYSDYSSKNDGSVKAWVNGTELYIGGYGKIIAGRSLSCALRDGKKIDSITGLELLDTSKTTDMGYLFNYCGSESTVFTLDLGDGFDTSKVTDMTYMFCYCGKNSTKFALNLGKNFDTSKVTQMGSMFYGCGYSSPTFTLNLGDKFDTSKVTYMYQMFQYCGLNSTAFTTLDLSTFIVGADTTIDWFADSIPVTKFIFGKGWRNAALPAQYTYFARCSSNTPTEIVGATKNLLSYDWTRDNRTVTFTDNTTYTITPAAEDGGTVSGGGTVLDGESITLTAAASDGYSFDGWYDGDTKVCDTEKFVIEDAADDKTYTAKFATYYTVSAEVGTGGGTVSGGGKVAKGTSITLTATANEGYTFDGWYDGDTKVCDTVEFVVDNVTADKTYTAKFTEKIQKTSKLFSTDMFFKLNTVLAEDIEFSTPIKIISFVDLNDYDLEGITTSDYSADLDGSVLAWYDEATFTLYIGGYGKIIAGRSLAHAFAGSIDLNRITGLDMLDTSNVTDMEEMFSDCGRDSKEFTLDLGDNFDTSNVTNMKGMFDDCGALTLDLGNKFDTSKVTNMYGMFYGCVGSPSACTLDLGDKFDTSNVTNMGYLFSHCGSSSKAFTLNLGDKFDTSNVTHMEGMFSYCGRNSRAFALDLGDKFDTSNVTDMRGMFTYCGEYCPSFSIEFGDKFDTSNVTDMSEMFSNGSKSLTTLDLSTFNVGENTKLDQFAYNTSVNTFIFGDGWKNATLPSAGRTSGAFYNYSQTDSTVIGATENLCNYDWASDNRIVNGLKPQTYTVTANAETGGTVSGGGTVIESSSITLTATADDGYTFAGWYDGETKVCDTAEFVVSNVTADKIYTAKFTKNAVSYTISAEVDANGGGTVSGGGEVAAGGSITLTASANDGYTFAGWYDGDTKVCDTPEFVVTNVAADKTYTAKFTKNQVAPEPEEPEIPYLKWDGSTLTLVKKTSASCRVGIVYVGGATFDADNINWDKLVSVGKEYANLNSAVGYAVYSNFTKRTPGTRGNYVAFVKYTKDDGTTTADYITFNVKDAVSFEIPSLSYNVKTKTLKLTGDVSSTIGIAYVGDAEFNASNLNWNDFIKAGKQYTDVNGSSGYAKVLNTLDYTKTFTVNGNYVAFVKYNDENINKTLAKYYTFTVSDYEPQPEDVPYVSAQDNKIVLAASRLEVAKVTIAYIGTDDIYITNWSEFSAAAAKFSDINGKALNQQYTNPKDGSAWKQKLAGWYAVYIRYIKDGEKCNSYYTVELN